MDSKVRKVNFHVEAKLVSLFLKGFRGFKENCRLDFDPQLTVLIGENAAGKTSVLDAIAAALLFLPHEIMPGGNYEQEVKKLLNKWDVNNSQDVHSAEIALDLILNYPKYDYETSSSEDDGIHSWSYETGYELQTQLEFSELSDPTSLSIQPKHRIPKEDGESFQDDLRRSLEIWNSENAHSFFNEKLGKERGSIALPVLAYYATGRMSEGEFSNEQAVKSALDTSVYAIYANKELEKTSFSFSQLKNWLALFQLLAFNERQKQSNKEKKKLYENIITAIIEALNSSLKGDNGSEKKYNNVYIDWDERHPNGVLVCEKGADKELVYQHQLSSGEKSIIALVADIARLLVLANPNKEEPLKTGKGIVLIDEVGLHLHPRWQGRVLGTLTTVFPQVQFIVTTHSPIVLSNLKNNNVAIIRNGQFLTIDEISTELNVFGASPEKIINQLQGLEPHGYLPEELKQDIKNLQQLINSGQPDEAEKLAQTLKGKMDAFHPLIIEAETTLELQKMLKDG